MDPQTTASDTTQTDEQNGDGSDIPAAPLVGTGAVLPPGAKPLPEVDQAQGIAAIGAAKDEAETAAAEGEEVGTQQVPVPEAKLGLEALTGGNEQPAATTPPPASVAQPTSEPAAEVLTPKPEPTEPPAPEPVPEPSPSPRVPVTPPAPKPSLDLATAKYDPKVELQELKLLVEQSQVPQAVKDKINTMLLRLTRMIAMGNYTKEFESVEQYIRWVTQIPYGVYSKDSLDLDNARKNLESHHYGLQHVKDTILEYLAVMKLQMDIPGAEPAGASNAEMSRLQGSSSHAPILAFVGIQGVGKTSIAKSIANALNRKFIRIALGAMGNVAQIRGIPRGEPDAEPGQIIKALIRAGTMNPVILLDEIDKTSSESGLRADLMAALLEILDPEQNSTFVDHYLDYPIDLSKSIFITTANNLGGISAALLDRLEVIRFGSYTDEEKQEIAKNYMLPKVREATGLTEQQLAFDPDVWPLVVRPLGFDAGVRQLERTITILARKVAKLIVEGKTQQVHITKENFREFIPEDIGVYS